MAEPFIAEIRIFAGGFAPRGWAFCDGQVLLISQNETLFSLIGTTYGGDGRTTTALPNLQGRAPMHPGNGPGLTPRSLGQSGGAVVVTLNQAQMANHTHTAHGSQLRASQPAPTNNLVFGRSRSGLAYQTDSSSNLVSMADAALQATGGDGAHLNMQPYLVMNFIIALTGIKPLPS